MDQQSTVENKEIRSERYTSKYLNKDKLCLLKRVIKDVKKLKNQYSKFCFEHLYDLFILRSYIDFSNLYWKQVSKQYPTKYIKQWNAQSIFQDVVINYITRIKTYLSNLDLSVSTVDKNGNSKLNITYYKKNVSKDGVIIHYKGDIKELKQPKKYTPLSKFIKYCVYCRVENGHVCLPNNQEIRDLYEYYCTKFTEERIVRLVSSIQNNLLRKIKKPNEYQTGSFRIAHKTNSVGTICSDFIYDPTNTLYKHWCKIDLKDKQNVYIPLEVNKDYHNFDEIRKQQWIVKLSEKGNKIDIIGTKYIDELEFKEENEIVGIDLNVKHNFCAVSNGSIYDYDRIYMKQVCDILHKIDKIGNKNLSYKDKRRLNKLCKQNEALFKKLIHDILNDLEKQNVTDIVLEDLGLFSATYCKNEEFDIKYSRLVRLLRLNNVKTWFMSQAEKRGIRVHLTNPAYSSQQCPHCGYISRDNRLAQEEFKCTNCNHENNADSNSAQNLKFRYTNVLLRSKLHKLDKYNRMIPKIMKKEKIKEILISVYPKVDSC